MASRHAQRYNLGFWIKHETNVVSQKLPLRTLVKFVRAYLQVREAAIARRTLETGPGGVPAFLEARESQASFRRGSRRLEVVQRKEAASQQLPTGMTHDRPRERSSL